LKKEGLGCRGEGRRARELETIGYSAAQKEETKNEEGGRREENESQSRKQDEDAPFTLGICCCWQYSAPLLAVVLLKFGTLVW